MIKMLNYVSLFQFNDANLALVKVLTPGAIVSC